MASYPEAWGSDESELWETIAGERSGDDGDLFADDPMAMALFDAGWLDATTDDKEAIRDAFFDYCIEQGYLEDRDDFDWDAWREAMGY
jgi:hypothetical protein